MKISKFEDLEIWKESARLTGEIYRLTNTVKFSKDYSLCDQIRRAVVSISSNIAEGFERNNNNELIRFLLISKGSSGEVRSQLYIAHTLQYIDKLEHDKLNSELLTLSGKIGKFITYLRVKRKNDEFTIRQ
jgi:four helix bundle protein